MYPPFVLHNLQLVPHVQAFLLVTRACWLWAEGMDSEYPLETPFLQDAGWWKCGENMFGDSVHLMPIY